jgi:hypothetical protein
VLINCRSSAQELSNAYTDPAHPFSPKDGSIYLGAQLGFTGPTGYLMTLLYLSGKINATKLWGYKTSKAQSKFTLDDAVEFVLCAVANQLNVMPKLPLSVVWTSTAGNTDRWMPRLRQTVLGIKLLWNMKKVHRNADQFCRVLVAPKRVTHGDSSSTVVPPVLCLLIVLLLMAVAILALVLVRVVSDETRDDIKNSSSDCTQGSSPRLLCPY